MKLYKLLFSLLSMALLVGLAADFSAAQGRGGGQGSAAVEDDPLQQPLPPGIRVRAFIHRPRVVEPAHLGTCTPDDSLNSDTNYGLTGWHLPIGGITWKLNSSTVPSSVGSPGVSAATAARTAITDAFATWTAADTQKVFIDGGNTTAKNARFDRINAILWKNIGAGSIAVTYVWYYTATGLVAEVDMIFNKGYPWRVFTDNVAGCSTQYDAYDLLNIATHEIGHWVGLDDLYNDSDADLTMYGFGAGGELKKRTLGAGDISGVNEVTP